MIVVERTFSVTAAPRAVLEHLTDFGNARHWDPAAHRIVRRDAGPLAPGATWHHVERILGVTAEMTTTLVAAGGDRAVFHGRNEGATRADTVTVRPCATGTLVCYRVELELHGVAKLATPILKVELEKLAATAAARLTAALHGLVAPPDCGSRQVRFAAAPLDARRTAGREAEA